MNLAVISLVLLLAAIVIGFVRNVNVGILSIGFAMILTLLFPDTLSTKDVVSGFSTSLFVQMVGVTYLFAIINGNGTLELLAKKIVNKVPGADDSVRYVPDRHGAERRWPWFNSVPCYHPGDRHSDLDFRRN